MKHDKELAWLLDENWSPKTVTLHTNRQAEGEEFDDMQAKLYGYKSVEDMHRHNYSKDKLTYLKYGDRTKDLI